MSTTIELQGFRELEAELERLSQAAGKGALRRAGRKAAEPLAAKARLRTPVDEGDLRRSITVSTRLAPAQSKMHRRMFRDSRAAVELFIGPSYDLAAGGRHGHLVEFGTKPHTNKGMFAGSQHPGTAPQPFMRPAFDEDHRDLLDRLGRELWSEVQKSIRRAELRAARKAAKAR